MSKAVRDEKAVAIGKRIAQARLEAGGMTQPELAALLKLSPRSVQAYENGEVVPYRFMKDLERVLNKPVAWFLHGDAALAQEAEVASAIEGLRALLTSVATDVQAIKAHLKI